jgi:hypothetical protein
MTSRVFSFPFSIVSVFVMLLVSMLLLSPTSARTISVGVGKEHASIQAAIDVADAGDTVLVDDGVYDEGDKRISARSWSNSGLFFFFPFFAAHLVNHSPSVRSQSNRWNESSIPTTFPFFFSLSLSLSFSKRCQAKRTARSAKRLCFKARDTWVPS